MYKIFHKNIRSRKEDLKALVSDVLSSIDSAVVNLCMDKKFDVKVILNELINNAIKHGNKNRIEKNIEVIVALSQNHKLFIVVEDCGNGYDLHNIQEITSNNGEIIDISTDLCENGRGIMIVKSLSDKVRVNKKGNQIIVRKNLN